ncbi:hypothetical protein JCM16303_005452 [Sporobolomyces ruberrimus]
MYQRPQVIAELEGYFVLQAGGGGEKSFRAQAVSALFASNIGFDPPRPGGHQYIKAAPKALSVLGSFFAGFILAIIRNWRLARVISTIIPYIGTAGAFMNKFVTDAKTKQLAATGLGATLAEEVISSVRSSHAFGTQRKLASLYNDLNEETNRVGQLSTKYQGFGLGVFFFIIYASYSLSFTFGTTLILQGHADAGSVVNVFFSILISAFSLAMLTPNLRSFASGAGAATEIFATIDRAPVIDSSSNEDIKPDKLGDGEASLSLDCTNDRMTTICKFTKCRHDR